MKAVQTFPPPFNNLAPAPRLRTLNDLRMGHDHDAISSSPPAKSMRPLLIVVLLVAAGAGIAFGVKTYSEQNAANIAAAKSTQDPVAAAPTSVPATSNVTMPAGVAAANGSRLADPLSKLEEVNPIPLARHGNNRGSESINPVKPKSSVAVKSASVPAKRVAPNPVPPVADIAPAQPEAAAPSPPPAILIEEKPVAPPAAAIVSPAEPAPQ